MLHNQVKVDNHQRRSFLCRRKNQVLTGIGIVGHRFDPLLTYFDATRIADCIDEAKLDYKDGKKDPDI